MKKLPRVHDVFISFVMFIFSLCTLTTAQVSSYEWADMISGSLVDESFSIAADQEGNCYVTGVFNGSADIGDTTLTSLGVTDIFLVKYNDAGDVMWIRQAGGKQDDDSYAVHISPDGYCYLTGSFADTAFFGDDTLVCFDNNIYYYDIFLAKYTLDGDLVWVTRAGEAFWDEAFGICSDHSGNVFITGSYWGSAKFDNITLSGLYGTGAIDGFDIFVAKYDSSGKALWANRMVERGWDRGSDVAVDPAGNCYVTGGFQTALLFGVFGGPSLTATGDSGDEDVFLVKYDSEGSFVWKTSAGGPGLDQARALTLDAENNIYLTGVFNDTAAFDSTHLAFSHGFTDAFLAKYDAEGHLLWVRGAGGEAEDGANDVITDKMGNVYICGYFSGPVYFNELPVIGGGQFIAKYNSSGEVLWVKQVAEVTNLAKSLALLPGGDLVLTGVFENTMTLGSTVLNGQGQSDVFVTKLDTVNVTTISAPFLSTPHFYSLLQNYPNPFNPHTAITYELPVSGQVELLIFNVLGEKVVTLVSGWQQAGRYQVDWEANGFASGIYYYQLRTGSGYIQTKKMILLK
jgi:hypothetical protein